MGNGKNKGKSTEAEEVVSAAVSIDLLGEQHVLRPELVGVAASSALRTQSHGAWRWPTLLAACNEAPGPEEVAGLVFLAGRQKIGGPDRSYDQCAADVDAALAASDGVGIVAVYDPDQAKAFADQIAGAAIVVNFAYVEADGSPEA